MNTERALNIITVADTVFILILSISGSTSGAAGTVLYIAAFILPVIFAYIMRDKANAAQMPEILPSKSSLGYALLFCAPFISLVMLLSFLTAILLNAFGFSDTTDVSGNIFLVLLRHALMPSVLEEGLFRFVPLMLLAPLSRKNALFASSLFFALIHGNLFQIPYALAAGFILAALTLISGSIFPAFLLHLLNNTVSVIYMRYGGRTVFNIIFFGILGLLTLISLAVLFVKRKVYLCSIKEALHDKSKLKFTFPEFLFIIMTIFMAILNLTVTA